MHWTHFSDFIVEINRIQKIVLNLNYIKSTERITGLELF